MKENILTNVGIRQLWPMYTSNLRLEAKNCNLERKNAKRCILESPLRNTSVSPCMWINGKKKK